MNETETVEPKPIETNEPGLEEPASEEPAREEPVSDELAQEEPVSEEPAPEEPLPAEPVNEEPPIAELQEPEITSEAIPEPEVIDEDKKEPVGKPNPGVAEFDWDAIGKKQDLYSAHERQKLEEVYDQTLRAISEHDVIEGTVVALTSREAVVNIGFKSDGVIQLSEFRYNPDLKPGDKVEVYVENQEDPTGQLILSHKKARILKSWERINDAFDKQEIIKGYVKSRTKGGLIVDVFGIEAFLPGSQIDVKPIRDYDVFVDKVMEFKVVKINHEYKNVVVSHKALIEDELEAQRAEIIKKLEKGQILEGTVKNITSYGVFIDLGGVDGLIHITDLSWGRINHPEEIVQLDQKIKVVILDFDDNKKRIALGLKQLTPHPWDSLDKEMKVGDKVKGKVVVIADYGAFVEIAAGVEGLIHVSEMSWSQHLRTAHDFLKVGQEVEGVILTLDREDRKMSMGIKQLIPDPWANIKEKYPIKSKHTAIVRNFTNFGIFVEMEEGVDGLIHISDLSWSKKIKHPAEFTKIGENIDVIVLDVDVENRRLSLGHKQLEENPWDVFESVFTLGSVHHGTIVSLSDKGAIVTLPYGVEGFAPMRHLNKEDGSPVKEEESLDFKVIEFSKDSKKIILSHAKTYQDNVAGDRDKDQGSETNKAKSTKKAVKKIKDNLEKTTLGDIEALSELKSKMTKQEAKAKEAKTKKEESPEKPQEEKSEE
ncbi:MAG: 30S ribosomal protein S1 [Bacteroidales bacterium]|nr:30S ribosomal protein S1 [Bacteroidales bacterium]